jgi:hypothetical protein
VQCSTRSRYTSTGVEPRQATRGDGLGGQLLGTTHRETFHDITREEGRRGQAVGTN